MGVASVCEVNSGYDKNITICWDICHHLSKCFVIVQHENIKVSLIYVNVLAWLNINIHICYFLDLNSFHLKIEVNSEDMNRHHWQSHFQLKCGREYEIRVEEIPFFRYNLNNKQVVLNTTLSTISPGM